MTGTLTGNADTFTSSANDSANETVYPVFVDGQTGAQDAETDVGLTYNPSTGTITSTGYSGAILSAAQSNITSLGTLTTLTVDNIIINGTTIGHTSVTDAITIASDGKVSLTQDLYLTGDNDELRFYEGANYVGFEAPSLSANQIWVLPTADASSNGDALVSDGSGNLSFSGVVGSNATTVTLVATNTTDAAHYLNFTDAATGNENIRTDTGLTYNPSSGLLSTAAVTTTGNIISGANIRIADAGTIGSASDIDAISISSGGVVNFTQAVTMAGALTVTGTTTLNGALVLGDAAADTLTIGATLQGASPLTFEGGTADGHETTFAITDPTADRTITFPDATGTVVLSGGTLTGSTVTATTAFVPDASDGAALGTSSLEFSDLFLADGGIIYFGNDQDVTLTHVADTGISLNGHVRLADSKMLQLGDSQDLSISHNGSDSYIDDGGTGALIIQSNQTKIMGAGGGETMALFNDDGAVTLYYDNAAKLATSAAGVTVTGTVTATGFAGALTGNVTGNVTGTAATVTTAAQTAITSLGTLTALQVDNLNINTNTISATSGALNITPAGGSAIVLDGTINVDAGVVTGATSITSTAFVGALTGDVTGNVSGTAATVTTAAQTAITSLGALTALDVNGTTTMDSANGPTLTVTVSNAGQNVIRAAGSHASYTGNILQPWSVRAASSAFDFIECVSSNGAAVPWRVTGDGTTYATNGYHPMVAGGADLGSAALEFNNLYLNDGGIIYFGNDQDVSLTHTADTGLLLNKSLNIDDGGSLVVGRSATPITMGGSAATLQSVGTAQADSTIAVARWSADANAARFIGFKSRHAGIGSTAIVADDDNLLDIVAYADDAASAYFESPAAMIRFSVDGTPGTNDMPGRITFHTSSDGGQALTERMKLDSSGNLNVTGTVTATAGATLIIKNSSGGTLKTIKGMS